MTINTSIESLSLEAFPLLKRLALSDDDFAALTQQGFVRSEQRGRKKVYRLRYRVRGRQRVRSISPFDAELLGAELALLQKQVRARRHLTELATRARQLLRQRKATLAPLLESRGYHFHGYQVRRCRFEN